MTDLTDSVQNCGLHCENCGETSYAISFTEAKRAIEEVKAECVEAIMDVYQRNDPKDAIGLISKMDAIKAIKSVR